MKRFIAFTLFVFASQSFAQQQTARTSTDSRVNRNSKSWQKYFQHSGRKTSFDFEGIVKLGGFNGCSGAVVILYGQDIDSKAYMMTNGHCLGQPFIKSGTAILNKPVKKKVLIYDYMKNKHAFNASKIVYATMTGTDLAIYQLDVTYRQLLQKKIRAFLLSYRRPANYTPIDIVSGYWDRGYRCRINGFVYRLKEASWMFADSIRYSTPGCEVIGGTSGSPIIQTGTRSVIGINSTINENGERCTMGNPCEMNKSKQIAVRKGVGYGQQTYNIYSCINRYMQFDLRVKGCKLTKSTKF